MSSDLLTTEESAESTRKWVIAVWLDCIPALILVYKADVEADLIGNTDLLGFVYQLGPNFSNLVGRNPVTRVTLAGFTIQTRVVSDASGLVVRNRASWTAVDHYRWNSLLSVVICSCPNAVHSSTTESTSDVGQD